jgi:hypothetical protein
MIKKYQYDYYDDRPMSLVGKLIHNLGNGIFRATALYASISLTALALVVFYAWKQVNTFGNIFLIAMLN